MFSKSFILQKDFYKPSQVARMLGVTPKTVVNYVDRGVLDAVLTDGGRRNIKANSLVNYLQEKGLLLEDSLRYDVIYGRVSTKKQEDDLQRQLERVKLFVVDKTPVNLKIISDIGSGLNDKRKGLTFLLKEVQEGNVSRIFVLYKDRLTRFGFHYLEMVCKFHNTELVIVSDKVDDKSLSEELAEDIIAIIHSFSGKLYGMRRKVSKEVDKALEVKDG